MYPLYGPSSKERVYVTLSITFLMLLRIDLQLDRLLQHYWIIGDKTENRILISGWKS